MTTLDIKFGETEGKREFSTQENLLNMFFKDEYQRYIESFLNGDKRYIYGLKGTGKSSLLKYLENKAVKKNIKTMYISYKDFREEADVINSFKDELKNTEDKDMYSLTFWRWYILSLVSNEFLSESSYNPKNLIYYSKVKFFKVLSKVLDLMTEFSYGKEDNIINVKLGNQNNTLVKWENTTADRIRELENSIKKNLSEKAIIFIDELELSTLSSSYEMDSILIKNLIKATRKINNLSSNLHVVLAVRSEVINSITASGDEINKELEDFGYEIEWHRRKFDIHHPLIKMFIQKIRYSMIKFIKNHNLNSNLINKVNSLSIEEIWYRWFPSKISNTSTPEFILQNTWLRPRDLSRLFRIMQNYCNQNDNTFKQRSYEEAIKKVGEDSWKEIAEELLSKYVGKDIEKIRDVFEKVQVLFLKDDFVRECKKFGFTEEDIENILNDLYKLSAIGNHFKTVKYAKLKTIYRFFYRNDKSLYHDKAITVHKAIEKGLGLSDFKSSLLINDLTDEEKNKYGCQNSFTDYEDEFQISIADRIREQKF